METMINELLKASIESGKGHQWKADSRRYKAFVQAIDELSAQLLIKKSGFEADIFNNLEAIRRELNMEIDAIEDEYSNRN